MPKPSITPPPSTNLFQTLVFLGQQPPAELAKNELSELWQWACQHWHLHHIPKVPTWAPHP